MGIKDESWCVDCGKSQPYSEDDVVCGQCTSEAYELRSNLAVNYMNLHLISLKQDAEKVNQAMDYVIDMNSDEYKELEIEDISLTGQIIATRHLLSVVSDTLGIELGEEEND